MTRDYLKLSMRFLQLEGISFDYRDMYYNWKQPLGETVYTLNTSNRSWPRGVTYAEMVRTRNELHGSLYERS